MICPRTMSAYYGQISKWGLRCQMYQGYDEVEDEDGSASDMSFALEYILRTGRQSESLDSFGPVRG